MPQFRIIVPVYRAERWIDRCVRSIRSQRGADFRCVVIDDRSPDDTLARARAAAAGDARILVEQAPERRFALANIVAGVREIAQGEEDVIVTVDGDDWLAHDRVLERLAALYADPDVWLTYGSHWRWKDKWTHRIGLRRRRGIAAAFPPEVLAERSFREQTWAATHLRTFRRFLWDAIRDEDLRDESGAYFRYTWDMAFMFPMLEMAAPDHVRYVHEVLYVYNNANPQSVHRVAASAQLMNACRIRLRPRYAQLRRG